MTPTIAVVGYSSMDTTVSAARFGGMNATTLLREPFGADAATAGGISYVTRAVARTGLARAAAVSWVGRDAGGADWRRQTALDGTDVSGTATLPGATPTAALVHFDEGGTLCFFTPSIERAGGLDAAQRAVLGRADWVVVTVGPAGAATEAVKSARAPIAWAVKRDEDAFPPALVRELASRCTVLTCNTAERAWLTGALGPLDEALTPGALVVETRGGAGVAWSIAGTSAGGVRRPGERVEGVRDSTGAGDTFVGTLLATIAAAGRAMDAPLAERAVADGLAAAAQLLRDREEILIMEGTER